MHVTVCLRLENISTDHKLDNEIKQSKEMFQGKLEQIFENLKIPMIKDKSFSYYDRTLGYGTSKISLYIALAMFFEEIHNFSKTKKLNSNTNWNVIRPIEIDSYLLEQNVCSIFFYHGDSNVYYDPPVGHTRDIHKSSLLLKHFEIALKNHNPKKLPFSFLVRQYNSNSTQTEHTFTSSNECYKAFMKAIS